MYRVSVYQSLEDLPLSYKNIFLEASYAYGLFFSYHWFNNLFATSFSKNTIPRIYAIAEVAEIEQACMAFVMRYDSNTKNWLSPRKLLSASNYYTSMFGPIRSNKIANLETCFNSLATAIIKDQYRWDIVDLHPMDVTDPQFNVIQRAFQRAGMWVQSYFCFGNWYLEVKGRTYQEYFNSLPTRLKNTIHRKSKHLTKRNNLRFEIVTSHPNLDGAIATFVKIYNSSWKNPEPHPEFIPGYIRTCAEHGWLRLGIAYIDEQPAAAQLWVVNSNIASIYKLAYDPQFSSSSVGTLLTAKLMQHVIDVDNVKEVDYLTGDDTYKKDWMSNRRERWGLIAYNPGTFRGALAAINNFSGIALKLLIAKFTKTESTY